MKYLTNLILVLLLAAGISGCSDFLNPTVATNLPLSDINTVNDLKGLMNDAYSTLTTSDLYGREYVIIGDIRTANAWSNGHSGRYVNQAQFNFSPATGETNIWDDAYEIIANCNLVIHSDVKDAGVKQYKGEAYAMRALAHMILLKVFGQEFVDGSDLGVPYVTTFNKSDKFNPKRLPVKQDYAKIKADYQKALDLLDPSVKEPTTRMTYYAAEALLSRFYLFTGDYKDAASAAKDVIDNSGFNLVSAGDYVASWAKDGEPSVLFGVAFTPTDNRGSDSIFQILAGSSYGDVEITQELYNLFGSNDVRKGLYSINSTDYDVKDSKVANDYRVTGKYIDRNSNVPVIRYAEVILTYAEAELRSSTPNAAEALTYLNKIASHRGEPAYTQATVANVLLERRKELAMEGDYYWQLLRNGKDINRVMSRASLKYMDVNIPYGDKLLAYPIPKVEMDANPNMEQNPGFGGS